MQQSIGTQRVSVVVTVHKLRGLPNTIRPRHDWLCGICALLLFNDGRRLAPGANRAKSRRPTTVEITRSKEVLGSAGLRSGSVQGGLWFGRYGVLG